jgi:outer membrane protein insertion porin family
MNMAVRQSQLRLSSQQYAALDETPFGCPTVNQSSFVCQGGVFQKFSQNVTPLAHTNYVVRMSTGVELQVIMPVVNAPFRLYYAYNPLRVDTEAPQPIFTQTMFPYTVKNGKIVLTGAGDTTYKNAVSAYAPSYRIREPRKTLRFTVATTF